MPEKTFQFNSFMSAPPMTSERKILILKCVSDLLAFASSVVIMTFASAQQAKARCAPGFSVPADFNYCVPTNPSYRKMWMQCSNESRSLGLSELTQLSDKKRIAIIDKFIDYCRRAKVPQLY